MSRSSCALNIFYLMHVALCCWHLSELSLSVIKSIISMSGCKCVCPTAGGQLFLPAFPGRGGAGGWMGRLQRCISAAGCLVSSGGASAVLGVPVTNTASKPSACFIGFGTAQKPGWAGSWGSFLVGRVGWTPGGKGSSASLDLGVSDNQKSNILIFVLIK